MNSFKRFVVCMLVFVMCMFSFLGNEAKAYQTHTNNFDKSYTLNGNGAHDMVEVAKKQVGKTGSTLGYTEDWCANFVMDVAKLAGQTDAIPSYSSNAVVSGLRQSVLNQGGTIVSKANAVAGDLLFVIWNSNSNKSLWAHVEIVTSAGVGSTIGGNAGSTGNLSTNYVISRSSFPSNYIYKYEIVRPNYKGNVKPGSFSINTCDALSTSEVKIAWNKSSNASKYNILRSKKTNSNYTTIASNLPSSTTTYTDSGLEWDQKYYYKIVAVNSAGETVTSEKIAYTKPHEIMGSGVSHRGATYLTIGWSYWEGYKYKVTLKNKANSVVETKETTDMEAVFEGLTPNTEYTYSIVAVSLMSGLSSDVLTNTATTSLDYVFPETETIDGRIGSFRMYWDPVDGATGYQIEEYDLGPSDDYTSPRKYLRTETLGADQTSIIIPNLQHGHRYEFIFSAIGKNGTVGMKVDHQPVIGTPEVKEAFFEAINPTTINATWTSAGDVDNYKIFYIKRSKVSEIRDTGRYETIDDYSFVTVDASKTQYSLTDLDASESYWMKVCAEINGRLGGSSRETSVDLPRDAEIITQPASTSVEENDSAVFSIKVNSINPHFRWQVFDETDGTWKYYFEKTYNYSDDETLSFVAKKSDNGKRFRCVINGWLISDTVDLVVSEKLLAITSEPMDVDAIQGQVAVFSVETTSKDVQYQWQYKKGTGTSEWQNSGMSGSNTATLQVPAVKARNGQQYRCVVTDGSGKSVTSTAAKLMVTEAAGLSITTQPANASVEAGKTATFTVKANGTNLSYQWQYNRGTGTSEWQNSGMSGSNTATLQVPAVKARNGQQYRCVVTDGSGNSVTSNVAKLMVTEAAGLSITTQPANASVEAGKTATFTVKANGTNLNYQWQYNKGTGTSEWQNSGMSGSNTATLQVPAVKARNGQQYRCVVTDGSGNSVTSNVVKLTVIDSCELEIITQPVNKSGKIGETVVFTVKAQGEGLTYQWQYKSATGSSWNDSGMTGNKTNQISVPVVAARNGQKYRCVITDKNNDSIITKSALLTVQ